MLFLLILSWDTIRTEHFTIFYPDTGYRQCALQEGAILEYYYPDITEFAHNKPKRTVVYIEDIGGASNGFALPFVNGVHIFSYIPYPNPQFGSMSSWWRLVSIHEFTHIANMTSTKGINAYIRALSGKIFQPNSFLPTWIAESYTVYSESRQFPYEGRLNEGFFDAYGKASARDNRFPSLPDITYATNEFPYYSTPYLWGGLLTKYRAKKYGDKSVSDWADNIAEILPLIFMPGLELEFTYWMSYNVGIKSTYRSLQMELKREIKDEDISQKSKILYSGGDFLSFLNYDNGFLYFVRHRIFKSDVYTTTGFDEIVKLNIDDGNTTVMVREPMLAPFPFRVYNGKIYYARGNLRKGAKNISQSGFKIVNDIYVYDTNTGERKKIYSDDGTLKSFDILEDGSILVAKQKGWRGGKIELIKDGEKIPIFESNKIVPLDVVANSGKITAIMHNEDKGNNIVILGKDTVKIETPYAKNGIHTYGDTILFSSNRNRKWEGYIWENKTLTRITDLPFCSYPVFANNKIYFIGLTSKGETIEETDTNFSDNISQLKNLSEPLLPSFKDLTYSTKGHLDNFRYLLWDPVLRLPIPYFDGNSWNLLMFVFGLDASTSRALIWSFNYSAGAGLTNYLINYFTSSITPFYIDIEVRKAYDYYWASSNISYPLYITTNNGLKGIYLYFSGNHLTSSNSLRTPLVFYTTFRFGDANKDFYLTPSIEYESKKLRSSIQRERYYLFANGQISHPDFSIHLSGTGTYVKNNSDSLKLLPISGSSKMMRMGGKTKIELNYQLFKIRKGLWIPSIYLDGLWFKPFGEVIYSPEWNKPISTIGALLSLETSAFFYLNILPSIGISYRIDEGKFYLLWSITGSINSKKLGIKNKFCFPAVKNKQVFEMSNYHNQNTPFDFSE